MRILVRILGDARVLRRLVERLPRTAGPLIEQRLQRLELFALQNEADLPGKAREVARLPQQHRIRLLDEAPLQIAVLEVAAVPILVEPRQHRATARHADGRGVVVIHEAHAVVRELVDVRRDHVLVAVVADGARREIVGEQEDDIGPRFRRAQRRGQRCRGQGENGEESNRGFHASRRELGYSFAGLAASAWRFFRCSRRLGRRPFFATAALGGIHFLEHGRVRAAAELLPVEFLHRIDFRSR